MATHAGYFDKALSLKQFCATASLQLLLSEDNLDIFG